MKAIKILSAILAFTFLSAKVAYSQSTGGQTTSGHNEHHNEHHSGHTNSGAKHNEKATGGEIVEKVKMKDGKMMMKENKDWVTMSKDMTMENGVVVKTDGTVKLTDGTTVKLQDGDCVDHEGKIYDKNKKMKGAAKEEIKQNNKEAKKEAKEEKKKD